MRIAKFYKSGFCLKIMRAVIIAALSTPGFWSPFSADAAPIHDAGSGFSSGRAASGRKKPAANKGGNSVEQPSAAAKKTSKVKSASAGAGKKTAPVKKTAVKKSSAAKIPHKRQAARGGLGQIQAEAAVYHLPNVQYPRPYEQTIRAMAQKYSVPADLIHAVVNTESGYNHLTRGGVGEIGLMQVRPATARLVGYKGSVKGLYNPTVNLEYGTRYLALAQYLSGGSLCGTVLKYNAGHGAKHMNPVSFRYCQKVKAYLYAVGYR